jgi:hypothetical protein
MKSKVVTCRKWSQPLLDSFVTAEEIGVRMDLDDYITALCMELGNPTFLVTNAKLEQRIRQASNKILTEIKKSTAQT